MKSLKICLLFFGILLIGEAFAQKQSIVTIEMCRISPVYSNGSGVSAFEGNPFMIKTIDANSEVTEKLFEPEGRKNPIETFPLLRQEIDIWLEKGYKLFSFNVTGEGGTIRHYIVILTKDE